MSKLFYMKISAMIRLKSEKETLKDDTTNLLKLPDLEKWFRFFAWSLEKWGLGNSSLSAGMTASLLELKLCGI